MKKLRPTLHVSILTLFIVFLFISSGTLTYYNYNKNAETALEIADSLMNEVDGKVRERVSAMFGATFMLAQDAVELPQIAAKPQFMRHPAQWFLAESLYAHPHIYSVYMGYSDGDFFQIISLRRARPELRDRLGAPDSADLAVRRVFRRPLDRHRIELWQFFDGERRMVGSRTVGRSYFDPRGRPWYHNAISREGTVHTPCYIFTSTGSVGMTVARRFDGPVPGVFGVDITLDELSGFLAEQKVGESGIVFMFDSASCLTAHPDPGKTVYMHSYRMGESLEQAPLEKTGDPLLEDLSRRLRRGEVTDRMILAGDYGKYLVHVSPVEDHRLSNQFVAVAAPVSDFTGSVDRTRKASLIFAVVISLLAIPVAVYFSRLISHPLRRLAREAEEIRRFNLESPVDIESKIAEIADLAKAVKTMKSSLSIFGRYVPKVLVRRLLSSNISPEVGGERRELTLLFTDIVDFTSISEGVEPEELMLRMSDYLESVGSEILECEGTIDKFIGDAIMAFWNAPTRQEDHAALACEAALRARQANRLLNDAWDSMGIPPMWTRFGLHTGEVIVGNVGSEDRLNFTAVGSEVNLASRLEGLNKYYGTRILASEQVRERAGDRFVFRSVGMVMPKGTSVPVKVYELLGTVPGDDDYLAARQVLYDSLEDWENAYAAYIAQCFGEAADMFGALAAAAPGDRLAAIMAGKAIQYQVDPPGEDWDGVDIFNTK